MSQIVAARYAKALYQEAQNTGVLDDVLASLRQLREVAKGSVELRNFLNNPLLTFDEQQRTLHLLFDRKIPALLSTFFDFIATKRRLGLLLTMADAFEAMYHDLHNEIIMKVTSAHVLEDGLKGKLEARISEITGKKVLGQYTIDPKIIGGIRVWAAGRLYEYSFHNELQDYKRKALQNV